MPVFEKDSSVCILMNAHDFVMVICVDRSEQGLELDLFLLQCCAALAPPDLFVNRIIERFGLSSYFSLNLERSTE